MFKLCLLLFCAACIRVMFMLYVLCSEWMLSLEKSFACLSVVIFLLWCDLLCFDVRLQLKREHGRFYMSRTCLPHLMVISFWFRVRGTGMFSCRNFSFIVWDDFFRLNYKMLLSFVEGVEC